ALQDPRRVRAAGPRHRRHDEPGAAAVRVGGAGDVALGRDLAGDARKDADPPHLARRGHAPAIARSRATRPAPPLVLRAARRPSTKYDEAIDLGVGIALYKAGALSDAALTQALRILSAFPPLHQKATVDGELGA